MMVEEALDPSRLPYQLSQWASAKSGAQKVHLVVRRGDSAKVLTLDWDDRWRFNRELPMVPRWSTSIPGLGIAYQINTRVAEVLPNSRAAELGFRPGDVVEAYRFKKFAKKPTDKVEFYPWIDLRPNEWAHVVRDSQDAEVKEVMVRIDRESQEITLRLERDLKWPIADRGLFLMPELRLVKAETVGQAVAMGWGRTWDFITGIYGNLRSLMTGRISFVDNIGGPITVAEAAYMMADEDNYQYILFLAIISINLAIVNFLPIPVLDGGHMVFLIYEKLWRRPASRQVRIATTYLGLALIVGLMVFVIYLDLRKKFT
jgi:regulator of sigma E protease